MKDIATVTGIEEDSDFPTGYKIVDGQTYVVADLYQDLIQTFQKILALEEVAPNGDFDNEANGYQLLNSLFQHIEKNIVMIRTNSLRFRRTTIAWNMETDGECNFNINNLGLSASHFAGGIFQLSAIISADYGGMFDLYASGDGFGTGLAFDKSLGIIQISRKPGGFFDRSAFSNATVYLSFAYIDRAYYKV